MQLYLHQVLQSESDLISISVQIFWNKQAE